MRALRAGICLAAVLLLALGGADAALAGTAVSKVKEIRHWSGSEHTRIVVDMDGPAKFSVKSLKSPNRMYMDFTGTTLGLGKKYSANVNDGLVGGIRSSQYDKNTVRIVLDLGRDMGFEVFSLKNPTRVVVDVFRKKSVSPVKTMIAKPVKPKPASVSARKPAATAKKPAASKPAPVVAKKPAASKPAPVVTAKKPVPVNRPKVNPFRVRRVVIDPGHGGRDPGAMANGLKEKHLVLDIAKRVKRELEKKGGYEVILTRSTDKFLELEQRAMVANNKSADIFVSIHINASKNRNVSGLETYILNLSTNEKSLEVAARENMVTEREMRKKRDELGVILASMSMNRDTRKSGVLAGKVQKSLVNNLRKHYRGINDHKDRGAMFYVLYRAHMPSVLVEVSYLTNKSEARRLRNTLYRSRAAYSIAAGIDQYFKEESNVLKVAMR